MLPQFYNLYIMKSLTILSCLFASSLADDQELTFTIPQDTIVAPPLALEPIAIAPAPLLPIETNPAPTPSVTLTLVTCAETQKNFYISSYPCSEAEGRQLCETNGLRLANIFGAAEHAFLASEIPDTAYYNSWNGDDYRESCIALFPGKNGNLHL